MSVLTLMVQKRFGPSEELAEYNVRRVLYGTKSQSEIDTIVEMLYVFGTITC